MSRVLLAAPEPGAPIPDSRRVSAACPWLWVKSATADGIYRLACTRCGAEWPVQAPTAAALKVAVEQMENNHQQGAPGAGCVSRARTPAFTARKKAAQKGLF